jgi:arylsulfatase A-like enzyme
MKKIIYLAFLVLVAIYFSSCQQKSKDQPPNIVLIFMDDMGYADIGPFGAEDYPTPNLDRLAENGLTFKHFYASTAVCSASRASLLTGCYAERVGIEGALSPESKVGIHADEVLIPEMLKEKNYATGIFGKWHLGHHQQFLPLQNGFDEYLGLPYSNDMWPVGYDGQPILDPTKHQFSYPPLPLIKGNDVIDTIASLEDQGELTALYTEEAIDFIERHHKEAFFLYVPHSMVHVPLGVSPAFKGKSGKGLFVDVMMEVDWSVGQIVKALEDNGLTDNTLVIFTSDNGPWLNFGNHAGSKGPLRGGKGNMWEGGPRVPTIFSWPGHIPSGRVTNELAGSIDILPTLAEISGTALPENKIDGLSLLPFVRGEEDESPRQEFCYYYDGDLIAVRRGKWKLVFPHHYRSYEGVKPGKNAYPGPYSRRSVEKAELYNLIEDVGEKVDRSDDYPDIVEDLSRLGDSVRVELGDRITNTQGLERRKAGKIQLDPERCTHLGIGHKIRIDTEYAVQYSASGEGSLLDGILGSLYFKDGQWLGFHGKDVSLTIDLDTVRDISTLECRFLVNQGSWIFAPESLTVEYSKDGKHFTLLENFQVNGQLKDDVKKILSLPTTQVPFACRSLKIAAKNVGTCPPWHHGAGEKAWLFMDEVVLR